MLKAIIQAAALAAAVPALAQSEPGTYAPPQPAAPPSQAYPPPAPPPAQQPPVQQPPVQQPPAQQPPAQGQPGQAQAQPPSSAGTGSGASTAPGTGAASQQVVVNPPQSSAPPPSTTVVNPPANPPPPPYGQGEIVVRERRERNPMATIATDAAYGGVAGLAVGFGVALINRWDNWSRDLSISTGAGILVGAIVGVAQAANDARHDERARDRYGTATDGLGSPARDPVIRTPPAVAYAGRF